LILISDTESDGFKFESQNLWCIVSYDPVAKIRVISVPYEEDIDEAHFEFEDAELTLFNTFEDHLKLMMTADKVCMHNFFQHDYPLLRKLYPWFELRPDQMEDTSVLSRLFNPDRPPVRGSSKPHSIEAWGIRFGIHKGDWTDFSRFTPDMLDYCIQDVRVGTRLWLHLQEERNEGWDWEQAIKLEYAMALSQGKQEMRGVLLDQELAYRTVEEIQAEIDTLDEQILAELPMRAVQKGATVQKPFKKDGSLTKMCLDWIAQS
jgi:hypothetical protein